MLLPIFWAFPLERTLYLFRRKRKTLFQGVKAPDFRKDLSGKRWKNPKHPHRGTSGKFSAEKGILPPEFRENHLCEEGKPLFPEKLAFDFRDNVFRGLVGGNNLHDSRKIVIHGLYRRINGMNDEGLGELHSFEIQTALVTDLSIVEIHGKITYKKTVIGSGEKFRHGDPFFLRSFYGSYGVENELFLVYPNLGVTAQISVISQETHFVKIFSLHSRGKPFVFL